VRPLFEFHKLIGRAFAVFSSNGIFSFQTGSVTCMFSSLFGDSKKFPIFDSKLLSEIIIFIDNNTAVFHLLLKLELSLLYLFGK